MRKKREGGEERLEMEGDGEERTTVWRCEGRQKSQRNFLTGPLIIDVALCVLEWCTRDVTCIRSDYLSAFLSHYQQRRPLTHQESEVLWEYCVLVGLYYVRLCAREGFVESKESRDYIVQQLTVLESIVGKEQNVT